MNKSAYFPLYFLLLFIPVWFLCSCEGEKGGKELFIPTHKQIKHTHNYYKEGERFKYNASYGLLNAGTLIIENDNKLHWADKTPCYSVRANCKLKGAAGWMSNLDDTWETCVDTFDLLPLKFSRHLQENKYRKDEFSIFNRFENKVFVTDTTRKENIKNKTFEITADMEDMISSLYLLRNANFNSMAVGDTMVIDVFLDESAYNIKVKYLGTEKVKSIFGKGTAYKIAPILPPNNLLSGELPVKAWITNDERRILLKVEANVLVGSLDLDLQEYSKK